MREKMEFDVIIIGGGIAGLSCACSIKQLNNKINVCIIEKGSEIGSHIISGAIFDPIALNELFPNWQDLSPPSMVTVTKEHIYWLQNEKKSLEIPKFFIPKTLNNNGNSIISLSNLCRWLAIQANQLEVEIFTGFSAMELLFDKQKKIKGIVTGDMGISKKGEKKENFMQGIELLAKQTVFSEGSRGHLGKKIIEEFKLDKGKDPQHFAIGIKELWELPNKNHHKGLVFHTTGWPLKQNKATGGGFMYHLDKNQVSVGLITDLNYQNPYIDPFEEFQRYKLHPQISRYLKNSRRIGYGARSITKGGIQSLPKMEFPGGLLIGCDAGTLNPARIKGSHTAMKSGLIAAEYIIDLLANKKHITTFDQRVKKSWLGKELKSQRNFTPFLYHYGNFLGSAMFFIDINIFQGKLPYTLHIKEKDHLQLKPVNQFKPIVYPKPNGQLTFDRLSSIFLSNTNHEENQPCHLKLKNMTIPTHYNLPIYDEPAQKYCPAAVYEIIKLEDSNSYQLKINSQNCVHCKTCDIKDPTQNINWIPPEGSGGPNYSDM